MFHHKKNIESPPTLISEFEDIDMDVPEPVENSTDDLVASLRAQLLAKDSLLHTKQVKIKSLQDRNRKLKKRKSEFLVPV